MSALSAHAKLTVSLRVTGRRDDGYHLLDAEMVTIGLYDTVEIEAGESQPDGPTMVDDRGSTVTAGSDPDQNLAARALRLTGARAAIHIRKRIPMGAGLGGGSADAAAVLRWAGWTDLEGAASIGSDVPFCMVGGRARVTGVGEVIEPLPVVASVFTLVTPPVHCDTAAIYRAWDELGGPEGDGGNDLEPAALTVAPDLRRWRDELQASTGLRPRLAGSGSTWFVEGAHPAPGRLVVRTVSPY